MKPLKTLPPTGRVLTLSRVRRWGAVLAVLAFFLAPLGATAAEGDITIKCSPAVVVLKAVSTGDCLTVHTDLPLRDVDRSLPVLLNGLRAYLIKADNRGFLVAKFRTSELQKGGLLEAPTTTLTLTGTTLVSGDFSGTDVVRVIE